jgi:hypothetical protein
MTEVEKLVRKARIGRRLLVGAVVAIAVGTIVANVVNIGQSTDITNVQRLACSPTGPIPKGSQCAEVRRHVALQEPIEGPCVAYQRVTGIEGRNCPHFYVPVSSHGAAAPQVAPTKQPTTTTTPTTTNQGEGTTGATPPAKEGPHHVGHQGKQPSPEVPSAGGGSTGPSPAPSPQPEPAGPPAPAPEAPQEEPPPRGASVTAPILEGVGNGAQSADETAKEIVCGLNVPAAICR